VFSRRSGRAGPTPIMAPPEKEIDKKNAPGQRSLSPRLRDSRQPRMPTKDR